MLQFVWRRWSLVRAESGTVGQVYQLDHQRRYSVAHAFHKLRLVVAKGFHCKIIFVPQTCMFQISWIPYTNQPCSMWDKKPWSWVFFWGEIPRRSQSPARPHHTKSSNLKVGLGLLSSLLDAYGNATSDLKKQWLPKLLSLETQKVTTCGSKNQKFLEAIPCLNYAEIRIQTPRLRRRGCLIQEDSIQSGPQTDRYTWSCI